MKLAIFDLGNVLFRIDFEKTLLEVARMSTLSPKMIKERISNRPQFEAFERGELSEDDFFGWLTRQLRVKLSIRALMEAWNAIYGPLIEPTCAAMQRLSGHLPLVALSNTNLTHERAWQARYTEMLKVFDRLYLSHELGMCKPGPRIYRHVLAQHGVAPEAAVFFDDLEANVRAAAEIGMAAHRVTSDTIVTQWVDSYIRRDRKSLKGIP